MIDKFAFAYVLMFLATLLPADAVYAQWVGSSSCNSSTCHGGTIGRGPAWNYSYSVSRSADPHATSGALLLDDDSARIVRALDPTATPDSLAYHIVLRKRCISCHLTAQPADVDATQELSLQQIGEGVSCESCHGEAGQWLEPHRNQTWKELKLERYGSTTGMLDTESMVSRAEGCVRCHVGSRTADGMVRDMNHDLIAAGHPALRFDLLTYSANMPHHWDDAGDAGLEFNRSAMKVRTVGRAIGLAAAAKLSSERATNSKVNQSDPAPWPELSDFDCFACHQTLLPRSYRLPINVDGKPALAVSNGLPLWNSWFTALDTNSGDNQFWGFSPKPGGQTQWIAAADRIASLYRSQAIVDAAAEPPSALSRFAAIKSNLNRRAPQDWHSAALIYLEMDAAARDLIAAPATHTQGEQVFKSLRDNVAPLVLFDPQQGEGNSRLHSPKDFDPREFRTNTLKALE